MTSDMYDWENIHKFQVDILIGIYVWSSTPDNTPIITCGFLEDDNKQLSLPSLSLNPEQCAANTAIELLRKHIGVDIKKLDIVPYGFFDPIKPKLDDLDMRHRTISLLYKTKIHPGTPVDSNLRFMTHEEIEIARERVRRSHYQAYRTGVGS